MSHFKLEIVSPSKTLFNGEVEMVIVPGEMGDIGILSGHAPLLSILKKGKIRVITGNKNGEVFEIESGFIEVNKEGTTILVK